jgi:predicted AAA+ superfamily ATPase
MIDRQIEPVLRRMAGQFKAVAVTGPRQSGKTTLAQKVFPEKPYVSLEAPDQRSRAIRDPRQFLSQFPTGGILDEVQRAPELFSYLQSRLDASSEAGQFILTGSQQFGMMEQISQSLAGRVGLLKLLPFSLSEMPGSASSSLNEILCHGAYPPIFDQKIEPAYWYDAYISTYVERDVRQILQVQDTHLFQRFLALCAGNIGQLFNASRIGSDCGLNHGTVGKWLSVLEASYVAFRFQPHHKNYRKRLVKTPKLYFYDVGLAIRLLGIETPQQLDTHPLRGALFENWVILEILKGRFNYGLRNNLSFWRNNTGHEIDVLMDNGGQLTPIKIKSGQTFASDWLQGLHKWLLLAGEEAHAPTLIYGGDDCWQEDGIQFLPWHKVQQLGEATHPQTKP